MRREIMYGMIAIILLSSLGFFQRSVAQTDEAFILLSSEDTQGMKEAAAFIEGKGGRITHMFPYHVLIGNVPPLIVGETVGQKNILSITYGNVDVSSIAEWGETAIVGARFWNYHLSPPPKPVQPPGTLPVNDAEIPPELPQMHPLLTTAYGAGAEDTSEYMMGTTSINVILVESTGAASTEDWSNPGPCTPDCPREVNVYSGVIVGLNWWASQNANAHLAWTWHFFFGRTDARAQTTYEPITGPATDENLWINEIMANFGYTTGEYMTRLRNFANDTRTADNTDWAYTIFVVDSLNDADEKFSDGKFAYSKPGGPRAVLTYDLETWGHINMDFFAAHETGHIFYALDEYQGPSSCTAHSGYLDVQNQNYDLNGGDTGGCAMNDINGIMRQGAASPYLSNSDVSPYTRGQIGWGNVGAGDPAHPQIGDADQDGISDIIDFNPTITLNAYSPDPTTDTTPTYTGSADSTQTLQNNNPADPGGNITINKITQVQYRVDSGTWTDAIATDGAFDEYNEDYTFTTSALSLGPHTIETRARNTAGNWSDLASDALTIISLSTLTINKTGTGQGSVTSNPSGIDCGLTCQAQYTSGTPVVLTPTANIGSTFAGWSGDPDCTDGNVTMNADKTCTATFTLNTYTVTANANGNGTGTVTSNVGGINYTYPANNTGTSSAINHGTNVILTATTGIGSTAAWNDCAAAGGTPAGNGTTTATCTFGSLDGAKTVAATFTLNTYPLTVTVVGNGSVTSNPAGIDCGSDCVEIYNYGTIVTLTAIHTSVSSFAGWSGDCTGTALTCTLTIDAAKNVTATFGLNQAKRIHRPSLRPMALNNIANAETLLSQASELLSQAKMKGTDTSQCEKFIEEATDLLAKAETVISNPIYANNLALQAIDLLRQAIECL